MKIRVLFFAGLHDLAGKRELECDLAENASLGDLQQRILREIPAMAQMKDSVRMAVNEEYAAMDHPLSEGDTVALIPPVSGG